MSCYSLMKGFLVFFLIFFLLLFMEHGNGITLVVFFVFRYLFWFK